MSKGFWKKLKKPIFVLAPMADVTDAAFRKIISKYGKPDVLWTEFVSADGLFLGGKDALIKNLKFTKKEKPIIAQFFTNKPEMMKKAAKLAVKMGFDGIDINMGCPDRSIVRQGAGSALIKTPELAREIIREAKAGAGKIPVSVKTRIGFNKNELETWLPEILKENPDAVIIHARTKKEMSKVPAKWENIKRAVEIRDSLKSKTLILGNGDVKDLQDARNKVGETGCDGIMFGRAIFGNPWLFNKKGKIPTIKEKLKTLVEHTLLFKKIFKDSKNFSVMKKHYKAYVNGWKGAKDLRNKLMQAKDAGEVETIIQNCIKTLK
jgi:nifR3 family TIM-barrel protein